MPPTEACLSTIREFAKVQERLPQPSFALQFHLLTISTEQELARNNKNEQTNFPFRFRSIFNMKFTLATTALVTTMATLASASIYDVTIVPKCKGVDFDALTVPEKEFVADVLEASYNQIHQLWDGGDQYLFGIEPSAATPELAEG